MSMYSLLQNKPVPTVPDIEDALAGNLCRCTGYRPILDAFLPFTEEGCSSDNPPAANGKNHCPKAVRKGNERLPNGSSACAQKNGCSKAAEVPAELPGTHHASHPATNVF